MANISALLYFYFRTLLFVMYLELDMDKDANAFNPLRLVYNILCHLIIHCKDLKCERID